MAENELWKNLLNQVQQTSQPNQQSQTNTNPQPINSPVIQPQTNVPNITLPTLATLTPFQNQPAIQIPQTQPSAFVGITNTIVEPIVDDEDEELAEQEDDFEDGVDTPVDNTFRIAGVLTENPLLNSSLISPTPEQINQNTVASIFNQTQPGVVEQKRGRGRPPLNKAENVVASLPNISNQQELDKSNSPVETKNAQSNTSRNQITASIPKDKIRELGESIARIGQTLIEISR